MNNLENKQLELHNNIPLLIDELNARLIERDELSRLVVLAMLSMSHMFLIGERGVAKSKTVELVNGAIEGATFWQLQVNADTKHEELFGAKTTTEDGTIAYLAKRSILNTHYGVLDEMFKALGDRLNSLLEVLVDRCYTSGDGIKKAIPLLSIFGTSNEYPTETRMLPYVDRFDFWYEVKRIQNKENRKKYLAGEYVRGAIETQYFSLEDIEHIAKVKDSIMISNHIVEIFDSITSELIKQRVKTSDRKYEKILHRAMKVSAYLNNRSEIDISDLFLLLHSAWHDEAEKEKVKRVVFEQIFGNMENIIGKTLEYKTKIEEIDTIKNANIYPFLNHTQNLDGSKKDVLFTQVINCADYVYSEYQKVSKNLENLLEKYDTCLRVEELIEHNLFVTNYKQTAFTQAMLNDIQVLVESVNKKMAELEIWYESNPTPFDYQNNFSKKHNKAHVA
ncbi:MAG: hypothetical protein EOM50_11300 [Erysipelotrichia bacterium]|nr:hypothetical protein [Erysipelotrichia bacterium]